MSKIIVAGIQVEPRATKEETLNRFVQLIDQAGRLKVKAVCLNDYLLYWPPDPERSRNFVAGEAESIPGPTVGVLARKAKEHEMLICSGSIMEKVESNYYVTSVLIDTDGEIVGIHRKTHLLNGGLKLEKDSGITQATETRRVYDTQAGKIGIVIDVESYDPKIISELSREGAKLIFWPISWTVRIAMASFGDQYVTARYIAKEAEAYVVSTNKVGLRKAPAGYKWVSQGVTDSNNLIDRTPLVQVLYSGGSIIVSKTGTVIGAAENYRDDLAIAAIDEDQLR
jgi:omega-amidase